MQLEFLLRVAGCGLLTLAVLHIPLAKYLNWKEEAARMSPANEDIFNVHNLFICILLIGMALPCLIDPGIFLEKSKAAAWGSWSISIFWAARLHCQWFVYRRILWQGKGRETALHYIATFAWLFLTLLFGYVGLLQLKGI